MGSAEHVLNVAEQDAESSPVLGNSGGGFKVTIRSRLSHEACWDE